MANVKIWGGSSFAPPNRNEESEYYRPYGIRVLTNHTAEISRPHLHREGYIDQYDSPVTLTDLVSGQSGQFFVPMAIRLTWNSDGVFVEKLPFTARLTLGGNIYSVENDYDSYVKVTVTPPVPEPATVMVMGLGLLGLGLARRFRRSPR